MKLTNRQIYDSVVALAQAKDETGLLGYAVAVNLRKLQQLPEFVEYSRKRDDLLAVHGVDIGGGKYNLTTQGAAAFYADLEPLAAIEADVAPLQVAPAVFYGGGLTSEQMYTLNWMAKEE